MTHRCIHTASIHRVAPSAPPNRHARAHFEATGHPFIEGYDPPEGWGWCYIDSVMMDLGDDTTPQNGPIPRTF